MPESHSNVTLHQWPPFREAVKNLPSSDRELFLREHAKHTPHPAILELVKKKAGLVMCSEMLPYERYNNADHVINEWYSGDSDLDLSHERTQLRAAIAWTLKLFEHCANFQEIEKCYKENFSNGSQSKELQIVLTSPATLPEHVLARGFAKGRALSSELNNCLGIPLDESGFCYADRAARIFKMVARYKLAEEHCFAKQLEMPSCRNEAGVSR